MPGTRAGDALAHLRIGIYRIERGAAFGRFLDRQSEYITVDDRTFAGKALIEIDGTNELIEIAKAALVARGILRLQRLDIPDRLLSTCFVSALYHRAPGIGPDADQKPDDRDNDHQLDQVKTALVGVQFS